MNTGVLVSIRFKRIAAVLLSLLFISIPIALDAKPAELARFEGSWGFVSSDQQNSGWGNGFGDGAGACGAPKQLMIDIREEDGPDGSRELYLRMHPEQPIGALITSISGARLTTDFMGDVQVYELRKDGRLVITLYDAHLVFKRC